MEQNFTAALKDLVWALRSTLNGLLIFNEDNEDSVRWSASSCCIKRRASISQLMSCSQDSFPAGLRSSVVPLHPVDFRGTRACQTEYTLIASDWHSRYFFSTY